MFRWHVVSAVFWRNVKQYFSSVQGYLFIVVFVTCCAVLTFSPQFFADNLANLDKLSRWFPLLLLFLVPGITMGVWADEKRQGTDAILFTLPASNFEILMGKFLSVAAVYTVALLFSTTQLIALSWIGAPDWGVVVSTYFGYWLAGLALLSVGMFASSLTSSSALAFVLGDFFCAIPVAISYYFRGVVSVERWGFDWNLSDFTVGLIPLSSVLYFVFLVVVMLYLNLVVISRRLWSGSQHVSLGSQFALRSLALLVGLLAVIMIIDDTSSYFKSQLDLTKEKLYTLDQTTLDTLKRVRENEKPVKIQAFISTEVPRDYVNARKQFSGLLRQYDVYGGNFLEVEFVNVAPNSPQEKSARQLGIRPRDDRSEVGGRSITQKVYLGAHVSSAEGDMVLPMLDGDSAIEYELSHAIALTSNKSNRKILGILDTDAHFGGAVFEGRRIDWAHATTLKELDKQFELKLIPQDEMAEFVEPDKPVGEVGESDDKETKPEIRSVPDVLLVADPSSLSTPAMDALVKYVEAGNPVLILVDPMPFFFAFQNPTEIGVLNAPRQPRVSDRSPYRQILTSSTLPKNSAGTASKLLDLLGIEWDNGAAVWNLDNPHRNFGGAWMKEFFGPAWPRFYGPYEKNFIWARPTKDAAVFNLTNTISNGLNELLFFYPGSIKAAKDAKTKFEPLVTLGKESGETNWSELTMTPKQYVQRFDPEKGKIVQDPTAAINQFTGEDLIVINPEPRTIMDKYEHVIAAQVTGEKLNVVVICDTDFVSEVFYAQQTALGLPLDNLALLQNAIEVLAGEAGFVSLRNRRETPRTLTKLEAWTEALKKETVAAKELAQKENRDALKAEQEKLNKATKKIQEDQSLSSREKLQQTFSSAGNAQKKYDLRKTVIDRELQGKLDNMKSDEQQKIKFQEERVQVMSILLAPLPALLLGIFVLAARTLNERQHIRTERRV